MFQVVRAACLAPNAAPKMNGLLGGRNVGLTDGTEFHRILNAAQQSLSLLLQIVVGNW
jgi:hypothetical protein